MASKLKLILSIPCIVLALQAHSHEMNENNTTVDAAELLQQAQQELQKLDVAALSEELHSPVFGSAQNRAFSDNRAAIRNFKAQDLVISRGDVDIRYDVILQPGHFWRTSGATGTEGQHVSERNLVALIVKDTARLLRAEGHSVLVIGADGFNKEGLRTKVFLALHADGNDNPCSSAPSMGYDDDSDLLGVHSIGYGLSQALGYSYEQFMDDGFVPSLTNYYTFKHIRTSRFEGILELGELTCPDEEVLLVENALGIANNLAVMLSATVSVSSN